MRDIIDYGLGHEDPTVRQYASHLERMLRKRGYKDHHLRALAGALGEYLDLAPKYSKQNARLNARVAAWGILPSTYRQYQADGRRMIEFYHGDLQARQARRERKDGFARLKAVLPDLIEANFIREDQTRGYPKLCDLARLRGWDITDLTRDRVIQLREECSTSDEWTQVKRGAGFIDLLRQFPTCRAMLPHNEIGSLTGVFRNEEAIPEFLFEEVNNWVTNATVEYDDTALTEEAREATAKRHSSGNTGIYRAALRTYVRTAGEYRDLKMSNGLTPLFELDVIEKVLVTLCERSKNSNGLEPRSLYEYASALKLTVKRRGLTEEAEKLAKLISRLPVLIEGAKASEQMSPKTKAWCRNLIQNEVKTEIFETQHLQYAAKAQAALEMAALEKIDLGAFVKDPASLTLSTEEVRIAKRLLRQARMFGTCAAFAAIAIDVAPFRKSNILRDLNMDGHPQTFFDHRSDPVNPHFVIHIPNELLKNGKAMTARGQHMPPFPISEAHHRRDAFNILSFYLACIRPLFGGSTESSLLFPAIEVVGEELVFQTFDSWLAVCSDEIGLPLTSHNFRHGLCSIEINEDPSCFPQLETITGDTERVLRRNYTFIDAEKRALDFQETRYRRRANRSQWSREIRGASE